MSAGDVIRRVIMSLNVRRPMEPSLPELSSARRALFTPVDHEENLRCLQEETNKIKEQQKMRWNFDFEQETPLEGRYELINVEDAIPPNLQCENSTADSACTTDVQQSKLCNPEYSGAPCLTSFAVTKTKPSCIAVDTIISASSVSKEEDKRVVCKTTQQLRITGN
ncbi:cyclin-dependent kinase inhibitor 1B-like [Tachypleus tridentatus]|uniref:cyclin-dependent kinase inhibitor 1B-like n=1 Tax=Tachypleus tridentatus TaxID=6853 RepID=UPI003FD69E38